MLPWFHRTVRPQLDRLGLFVFACYLIRCPEIVEEMTRPGCFPPWKVTRQKLDYLTENLLWLDLQEPHAFAPFEGTRSLCEWMGPHCRDVYRPNDGWDRPIVVRWLASPWRIELRSAGADGELHTHDDIYLWFDEDGDAVPEQELQRATLTAAVRRLVGHSQDSDACRLPVQLAPYPYLAHQKNIPCEALLRPR